MIAVQVSFDSWLHVTSRICSLDCPGCSLRSSLKLPELRNTYSQFKRYLSRNWWNVISEQDRRGVLGGLA